MFDRCRSRRHGASALHHHPVEDGPARAPRVSRQHPTVIAGTSTAITSAACCPGLRHPPLPGIAPRRIEIVEAPEAATTDFSSLRLTLYDGSPISLGLIKRAIAAMPGEFMQFYGSTEAGGASSILRPREHDLEHEGKPQSCGRPLPLIELRIVDAEGREVADGQPGELPIRQPWITKGYWRQPYTAAAVIQHDWYRSGDIARRDEEQLYYIVDRTKDMIVSGGENIDSAEIENVRQHAVRR